MPQTVLSSPFTAGSVLYLPDIRIGEGEVALTLRVGDDDDTDSIYFALDGFDATATHAAGFLNAGESVSISGEAVEKASKISITAKSGTPKVFFGIT